MTEQRRVPDQNRTALTRRKKRRLAALGGLILLLALLLLFILTGDETTTVGFFGIPREYSEGIRSLVEKDEAFGGVRWVDLSEEDLLSRRISRKVDLLISYNGYATDSLVSKALPLPDYIGSRYPRSILGSPSFSTVTSNGSREFKVMPILLNHYEAAYFKVLQKRTGLPYPRTLEDLENYVRACREWTENPIVCAGGSDENLFLVISLLAESLAGADGYHRLVGDLRKQKDFNLTLSLPLRGKAPGGTSFKTLLDILRRWQNEGLLLPDWYEASENLVTVFMEDNHAALVLMSLEEHRKKPFLTIKYFQANPFPAMNGVKEGTVEPAISVLCFKETELTGKLLNFLSSGTGQEALSAATLLGPAAVKGAAFDLQADDARYFAAASSGGPVPDLGRAVYLHEKDRAAMAQQIRHYLSQP